MAINTAGPRPKVTIRVVRADGGPETAFSVRKDETIAGTAGDILLVDDPFVARSQARLAFSGGALVVEDIGGGSGVFTRLKAELALSLGREVRCGRQRLLFEALSPAPTAAPRIWGSPDYGCRGRLIQILEGGIRGDAYPLKDGDNLVGREVGDITFPGDGFVSGRHAVIAVGANDVTIRDAGSSNGTFVRIEAPTPLNNGDQLLIGRQLLKLEIA